MAMRLSKTPMIILKTIKPKLDAMKVPYRISHGSMGPLDSIWTPRIKRVLLTFCMQRSTKAKRNNRDLN